MVLRWTQEAADDLEQIADYVFDRWPAQAAGIIRTLHDAPSRLLDFPYRGRPGRKEGTRELVLTRFPYVVIYNVSESVIHVLRIMHSAQNWP